MVAHVAALRAWDEAGADVPVNVKVIIEGEEEIGSPHLEGFLDKHGELLVAESVVIADLVNWKVGTPALTYVLRGMTDVTVDIVVMDHAVHSGMFGGAVPDPVLALTKLVAGLTDEHGTVTHPALRAGLTTAPEDARLQDLPFDESEFRIEAGLHDGVPLAGDVDVSVLQRIWLEPSLAVLGIDVPNTVEAANAIQPRVRAKLAMRLGPGQDSATIRAALVDVINASTPLGLTVCATPGEAGEPFRANVDTPAAKAMLNALKIGYGTDPVLVGCGGSIPMAGPLQAAYPDATLLMVGVEDPSSRAHSIDESLHLGDWKSSCRSIAALFDSLRA